jgi:hypothetical protein
MLTACASGKAGAPPTPAPSSSASPSGEPVAEVVATVPVGGGPIGIATGEGSIWVVNSEFRAEGPGCNPSYNQE